MRTWTEKLIYLLLATEILALGVGIWLVNDDIATGVFVFLQLVLACVGYKTYEELNRGRTKL